VLGVAREYDLLFRIELGGRVKQADDAGVDKVVQVYMDGRFSWTRIAIAFTRGRCSNTTRSRRAKRAACAVPLDFV